jgi:GT2 family glycosyltransferase
VSVISHRQGALVSALLDDLSRCMEVSIEVIVTINIPEEWIPSPEAYPFPLKVLSNSRPLGFGANQNRAFAHANGDFFCVLNPDIRISRDPFPQLVGNFNKPNIGAVAPQIVNPRGGVEDSARRFPTLARLLKRIAGFPSQPDYEIGQGVFSPDWVAGMFVLFRREAYAAVRGFDESYFLYYEDVDLCARLRRSGWDIVVDPGAAAIHDARHESHRNPVFLFWHLRSMGRYLMKRQTGRL